MKIWDSVYIYIYNFFVEPRERNNNKVSQKKSSFSKVHNFGPCGPIWKIFTIPWPWGHGDQPGIIKIVKFQNFGSDQYDSSKFLRKNKNIDNFVVRPYQLWFKHMKAHSTLIKYITFDLAYAIMCYFLILLIWVFGPFMLRNNFKEKTHNMVVT